ncbi:MULTISPECIES: hypothetical protein [Planococcus]|nr:MULTISPECIES: hypothetical protein [Planococcus]MDJ0333388.1 hypothetical protein [Planococcus sp. S3-L1]
MTETSCCAIRKVQTASEIVENLKKQGINAELCKKSASLQGV